MDLMKRLIVEEEGQGLVEYALIIGLVAILLIAGLTTFKDEIVGIFTRISNVLKAAAPAGGTPG